MPRFLAARTLACAMILAAASACSQENVLEQYPGLLEACPGLEDAWFQGVLSGIPEDGVFLLAQDGQLRTQRKGHPITASLAFEEQNDFRFTCIGNPSLDEEATLAQLQRPMILVEPGTNAAALTRLLHLCAWLPKSDAVYVGMWNGNDIVTQITVCYSTHCADYPESGLMVRVETLPAENGGWTFRWGKPDGLYGWTGNEPVEDEPLPFRPAATLDDLVQQLQQHCPPDKVIHLWPAANHDAADVLRCMRGIYEAGFLYVDLE